MRQNIWCGYFAIDPTKMVEMVMWKAQHREQRCTGTWVSEWTPAEV